MFLATETLQIIHKSIALVLGVFEMNADVNCFLRADFLTIAAEDATEFVNLVNEGYSITLFILTWDEFDAIRGTDLWT